MTRDGTPSILGSTVEGVGEMKPKAQIIVLTGGPGAGKTAILELARKAFSGSVILTPEAASIIYGGGFWREKTPSAQRAAQRAIYHVQQQLERMAIESERAPTILCDRGTLDGLAYWPDSEEEFFKDLHTTRAKELSHYQAVIHLRTPDSESGYNHANPLRIETAAEAAALDQKTLKCWEGHPHRFIIDGTRDFIEKADAAIGLIRELVALGEKKRSAHAR